jgi:hypothetical protein
MHHYHHYYCEICGFHGGEDISSGFLSCCAVSEERAASIFRAEVHFNNPGNQTLLLLLLLLLSSSSSLSFTDQQLRQS